jgi:hypothetical protein
MILDFVHRLMFLKTPGSGNWICFRNHFKIMSPTLLGPLERASANLVTEARGPNRLNKSFPTAPDGTGLTCGQHIESHSCIFSFPNRTVTSLFIIINYSVYPITRLSGPRSRPNSLRKILRSARESNPGPLCTLTTRPQRRSMYHYTLKN